MTETKKVTKKPTVGQKLKSARLESKLTLEEVSKQLCITKTTLKKIEDHTDDLSRDVYLIGFIRSYAVFLQLDANKLVQEFKDGGENAPQGNKNLKFPAPMPQESVPKTRILLGSAALAIILGFAVHQYTNQDSDAPMVAQSQPETVAELSPVSEDDVISIEPVIVGEDPEVPPQSSETILTTQVTPQAKETTTEAPKAAAEIDTPLGEKQVLMTVNEDS
jgi:cytoskeleton protein RodZ